MNIRKSGIQLTDDQWRTLIHKITLHATAHVSRWYWRGSAGGMLPDGFDSESVAAEAIANFLQDHQSDFPPDTGGAQTARMTSHGTGVAASPSPSPFLRAKPPWKTNSIPVEGEGSVCINHFLSVPRLQHDLERRVRRIVNRLHHRAENRLLRNEPDLAPVLLDDGEPTSRINLIPETASDPGEALLEKESLRKFTRSAARFSAWLGPERRLRRLFQLFCDGQSKPSEIASALKLRPGKIKHLCSLLRKKWKEFNFPSCPAPSHRRTCTGSRKNRSKTASKINSRLHL